MPFYGVRLSGDSEVPDGTRTKQDQSEVTMM